MLRIVLKTYPNFLKQVRIHRGFKTIINDRHYMLMIQIDGSRAKGSKSDESCFIFYFYTFRNNMSSRK